MAAGATIAITQQDIQAAARADRDAILRTVSRMNDSAFGNFVRQNIGSLRPFLKKYEPAVFGDISREESIKLTRNALRRMTLDLSEKIIDGRSLGIKKTDPQEFAQARFKEEIKTAERHDAAKKDFIRIGTTPVTGSYKALRGLYGMASNFALTVAGLGEFIGGPPANLLSGMINLTRSPAKTRATLAGLFALGGAGTMMMPVDSAPYLSQMGFQQSFKAACMPNLLDGLASNVAYTLNFNSKVAGSMEKHAHDTMIMASYHGVPAIALHLISYLESAKFTDMRANNSSASNPFQVLDATRALYIKAHGQDTFIYQDAKERVENGTASVMDNSIVNSIDAVSRIPLENLSKMVEDKKYPGYVHDALVIADLSAMSAEMIAMDLLEKSPEIANGNLDAEKIVDIVKQYYAEHHFLGMGNYRLLSTIATKSPKLSITDYEGVKAAYGTSAANKLRAIVSGNEGLLKSGMTASQALQSITDKFRAFVDKPLQEFQQVYAPTLTTIELCLTEDGKALSPPKTIPQYQAILISTGLAPFFKNAMGTLPVLTGRTAIFNKIVPARSAKDKVASMPPERAPEPAPT